MAVFQYFDIVVSIIVANSNGTGEGDKPVHVSQGGGTSTREQGRGTNLYT